METKRRRRHARAMPHGYPIFKKRTHGDVSKQRSTLMRQLDFYLEECLRRKIRGALVFDIDETLIGEQTRRPIRAVHALYDKYRTHFPTYLVSARGEDAYKYTVDELARHGIGGYRKLMLLPKREAHDPGAFKARARREIARKEGRVLAACGDQVWDALPWPVPSSLSDLDLRSPRGGAMVRWESGGEVGVLLPAK